MTSYRLAVSTTAQVPVIAVEGEIDLANAVTLAQEVLDHVPDDARGVVLDLAPTAYLDNTGIRAFFTLGRHLAQREQVFAVAIPAHSPVWHLLKTTHASEVAELCETVDAAVDAVTSAPL